jgi:ABC-type glycerol-3-phosphate transport system permease component
MNTSAPTKYSRPAVSIIPRRLRPFLTHFLLVLVTLVLMIPILWMLVTSVKLNTEYMSYPIVFLPRVFQWVNYAQVFTPVYNFLHHAILTFYLALISSTLTVISSSLVGYAFARYRDVKENQFLFGFVIALLIIPGIVTIIPSFMIFAKVHLTGTYWPWVIWGVVGSPYYIFLFRQFFVTFPKELEDAAEVDGCTAFGTYWRIFMPNAMAAIATSFILNFIGVWGDWFTPNIFLRTDNTTLAVIINTVFVDPHGDLLTPLTMAGIVIFTLPIILIFFLGQRYIIKGIVTSGLSGR